MKSSVGRLTEQLDKELRKKSVEGFVTTSSEMPSDGIAWHVTDPPRKLRRVYAIENNDVKIAFVSAIIRYSSSIDHYQKITLDHNRVTVDVYTAGIDDVTFFDRQVALKIDEMLVDALSAASSDVSFERFIE